MGLIDNLKNKMVEKVEDDSEAKEQLASSVGAMWDWLRTHLDAACEIYQKTGNAEQLQACLAGRALEDTVAYFDQLRANNIVWSFPDRREQAQQRLRVEEVIGNSTFIVTEYFRDHSRLEYYQHEQLVEVREADGGEKVLRATIQTDTDGNYYISEVAMQSTL